MELLLVVPILLIVLTGLVFVGRTMYEAQLASDTLKSMSTKKQTMLNATDGLGNEDILLWTSNTPAEGNIGTTTTGMSHHEMGGFNSVLDEARIFNRERHNVVIGYKTVTANVIGNPIEFRFAFAVPIQAALMLPNENDPNDPNWEAYFGTPRVDLVPPNQQFPWLRPKHVCGGGALNSSHVDRIHPSTPPSTFQPRNGYNRSSGFSAEDTISLSYNWPGDTGYTPAGVMSCDAQNTELTSQPSVLVSSNLGPPIVAGSSITREIKNPPGAPEWTLSVNVSCGAAPDPANPAAGCAAGIYNPAGQINYIRHYNAPNGMYYDSTLQFSNPPGMFQSDCQSRYAAEDQLNNAIDNIAAVLAAYPLECQT